MTTAAFCDHVFIRRLSELDVLALADKRALLDLLGSPRRVAKGRDIVVDGSASTFASIIVSGVACRYEVLSDGQRQILGFLLPGDMAEDFGASWSAIDHGVSASTPWLEVEPQDTGPGFAAGADDGTPPRCSAHLRILL